MSDLGTARQFLGLEIDCLPNGNLRLYQRQFILKILNHFNMPACNGVHTPIEAGQRPALAKKADEIIEPHQYQTLGGSLIYVAIKTQPDLAFAIGTLSKYHTKLTTHFLATKRVLQYLKKTIWMLRRIAQLIT